MNRLLYAAACFAAAATLAACGGGAGSGPTPPAPPPPLSTPRTLPTSGPLASPSASPTSGTQSYPCDIAGLRVEQAKAIPETSTGTVDACGTVSGNVHETTSSGTTHLHFNVLLDDGDGTIEIVSNENLMGTFTVQVGDYVYVRGQYYHDADGTQGIHDTHCHTSTSWPYPGWVIDNGVSEGADNQTCVPLPGASPTAAPTAAPSVTPPPAVAGNAVANPSFEDATLAPWSACSPSTNGHPGAASAQAVTAALPDSHGVPALDGPGAAMIGVLQNGSVGVTGICQQIVVPPAAGAGKVLMTMFVWEGGSEKDTSLSDQEADVLSADGTSQLATLFVDSACSVTATEGFKKHCDPTQNGGVPANGGVWVQRGPYDLTAYANQTVTIFAGIWLGPTASISDFMYVDDVSVTAQ